jgi:hypothetical protein
MSSPNTPPDKEALKEAEAKERERIWESPVGTGTPIPFDPALHKPGLSKEELEKLLADEDDK